MRTTLTKRDTVRRMYYRAIRNVGVRRMSFSYVARAIGKSVHEMIYFIGWMKRNDIVDFHIEGRNIVFDF